MSGRLFVYGSLRSDAPRERAGARRAFDVLKRGAELEGRAGMAGELYAPAWYPGFVPGPPESVLGEVWRIRDEGLLARLDAYEGEAYVREEAQALRNDGQSGNGLAVTAWVYRYRADLTGVPRIASGDYLDWARKK